MKKQENVLYGALAFYSVAIVYILYRDCIYTAGLALGTVLILYALTGELGYSLIVGSVVGLIAAEFGSHRQKEGFVNEAEEEVEEEEPKPIKKKKVAPPPDNDTRQEFLGAPKKYKAPSEDDDKDFHLDAGTTFLNAYKSLKPDQIAAMTKDTQDLMQTQKQLMSTLNTLKPLIKDGKEMMNMFQSYFGPGDPTAS